jgi:hypothetical protein
MSRSKSRAWAKLHPARWRAAVAVCLALGLTIASGGCFSSEEGELFYGRVSVPPRQEFRWSDGGLPQIFDPALVAAPPDTDAVRAMFEGLTEYDPRTLTPVSGVATRWESDEEGREWIFHLRHNARWSNGELVTARDFVRSWRRTLQLGERAPHAKLLANLEGAQELTTTQLLRPPVKKDENGAAAPSPEAGPVAQAAAPAKVELGVKALDDFTLKVNLRRTDKNFPALVAHPVFRPVYKAENVKLEVQGRLLLRRAAQRRRKMQRRTRMKSRSSRTAHFICARERRMEWCWSERVTIGMRRSSGLSASALSPHATAKPRSRLIRRAKLMPSLMSISSLSR